MTSYRPDMIKDRITQHVTYLRKKPWRRLTMHGEDEKHPLLGELIAFYLFMNLSIAIYSLTGWSDKHTMLRLLEVPHHMLSILITSCRLYNMLSPFLLRGINVSPVSSFSLLTVWLTIEYPNRPFVLAKILTFLQPGGSSFWLFLVPHACSYSFHHQKSTNGI